MSNFYNPQKKELDDDEIVKALESLPTMYSNGEIAEVSIICYDIYRAILDFEVDG